MQALIKSTEIKMTSLDIANVTGKEHKNVMRDIRNEIEELGPATSRLIFEQSTYTNERGREYPCYVMGKKGAMQLALKYDPQTRYKVIERIEQLEKEKSLMSPTELALLQAQNLHSIEQRVNKHEEKLINIEHKVDNQITLSYAEQRALQKAVAKRVYELFDNPDDRPKAFSGIYREIKDRFGVASYKDVKRKDLQLAINYVSNWIPRRDA